ncbi:MAG: putative DNA-binding domain-containing protein [Magnetospiraceae bacterium]
MNDIFDIQDAFQRRLTAGDNALTALLQNAGPFMKVYDHAYGARLKEILAADFPALHTLLGDTAFEDAMTGYLAAHPSRHPSVRWLGRALPAWLSCTPPWNRQGMLADMAAFEWALGLAFDAPDGPVLTLEGLATVAPDHWAALTFTAHPALNTVGLAWDVLPFQKAVAQERDPEAAPEQLETPSEIAVWRDPHSLQVRFRAMAADEAAALAALRAGESFGAICAQLAETGAPDQAALRAASLLRSWIESGWLSTHGG